MYDPLTSNFQFYTSKELVKKKTTHLLFLSEKGKGQIVYFVEKYSEKDRIVSFASNFLPFLCENINVASI